MSREFLKSKNDANVKENGIGLPDGDWFCPSCQFGICGNSKIEFDVNIKDICWPPQTSGKTSFCQGEEQHKMDIDEMGQL
ncbi:hypothetical protein L6164_028700 [Bauhinia variegata]|uniref:Uncharacterized protein n=1 Tax=Bauhinia variegata TaxID=167791 RepID=A0ACB9L6M2_BAUVA|nr:hypothetical protein L6164_028700 [Bauhinia variegata]